MQLYVKKIAWKQFWKRKKSPNENVPWKLNWLAQTKPKRFEASCAIMHLHPLFTFANALLLSSLSSSFYSIDCSPYLSLQSPFMYHCPSDIDLLCAYIFIPLIQLPPPLLSHSFLLAHHARIYFHGSRLAEHTLLCKCADGWKEKKPWTCHWPFSIQRSLSSF